MQSTSDYICIHNVALEMECIQHFSMKTLASVLPTHVIACHAFGFKPTCNPILYFPPCVPQWQLSSDPIMHEALVLAVTVVVSVGVVVFG